MKRQDDPRHQARRLAVQTLFEWLYRSNLHPRDIVKILFEQQETQGSSNERDEEKLPHNYDPNLLNEILDGVENEKDKLDEIIAECAPEWPLNQIAKVDLSILRIASYELIHLDKTPIKVAIDEAVELAKEFGGDNSSKFVNGVLGSVVKKYVKREIPSEEPTTPTPNSESSTNDTETTE